MLSLSLSLWGRKQRRSRIVVLGQMPAEIERGERGGEWLAYLLLIVERRGGGLVPIHPLPLTNFLLPFFAS